MSGYLGALAILGGTYAAVMLVLAVLMTAFAVGAVLCAVLSAGILWVALKPVKPAAVAAPFHWDGCAESAAPCTCD